MAQSALLQDCATRAMNYQPDVRTKPSGGHQKYPEHNGKLGKVLDQVGLSSAETAGRQKHVYRYKKHSHLRLCGSPVVLHGPF